MIPRSSAAGSFIDKKITSKGGKDIFVAKYDPSGKVIWAAQSGGSKDDQSSGITKDTNGYIYLTGSFLKSASFGKTKLKSQGKEDIFVTKIDGDGNTLWAKQAGGLGNEYSRGIKLDSKGDIYITGEFNSSFDFGINKISNIGEWDICVLNFDHQGKAINGFQAGGKGCDSGIGITINQNDNCFVLGRIGPEVKFDHINIKNDGNFDVFIAQIKKSIIVNFK